MENRYKKRKMIRPKNDIKPKNLLYYKYPQKKEKHLPVKKKVNKCRIIIFFLRRKRAFPFIIMKQVVKN